MNEDRALTVPENIPQLFDLIYIELKKISEGGGTEALAFPRLPPLQPNLAGSLPGQTKINDCRHSILL